MEQKKESIFRIAFITLNKGFFGFIGFAIGLFLFILFLAYLFEESEGETKTTMKILPDAEGNIKKLSSSSPALLRIDIDEQIGLSKLTSESIELQLLDSRKGKLKDNRVKGILLHINSPGGGVFTSDDIYRALIRYKKKYNVPIYVYVDGLCASGGLYIASAADKIYASPVSIIGSVGIIAGPNFNVVDLMHKIGVKALTLTKGKGKGALNPFMPWKEGEEKPIENIIEALYQQFVDVVTSSRTKINKNTLINDLGASIYISKEAEKLGYIDVANASYSETIIDLKKASGIQEHEAYQVVQLEPPSKLVSEVFSSFFFTTLKNLFFPPNAKNIHTEPFLYLYKAQTTADE